MTKLGWKLVELFVTLFLAVWGSLLRGWRKERCSVLAPGLAFGCRTN